MQTSEHASKNASKCEQMINRGSDPGLVLTIPESRPCPSVIYLSADVVNLTSFMPQIHFAEHEKSLFGRIQQKQFKPESHFQHMPQFERRSEHGGVRNMQKQRETSRNIEKLL